MKRSGMYFLSPMEMAHLLGERAQATHGFATTAGDAPWPERFASDACAQHPKYCQGLRRKTVEQKVPRESEPVQRAGSCDAFSYLLIVCAWCQQHIGWQRVQTPTPLNISHGICAHCYVQVSREIEH
jgi:hypothetical protein